MPTKASICVDIWGDFAMFTRPESKVERNTYLAPTPSSIRGVLSAIYSKPVEFYYEITKIEVMNPIKTLRVKKNELKSVVPSKTLPDDYHISPEEDRTQRINTYLRDVYYRVTANIVMRDGLDSRINIASLVDQFTRRVRQGKCFYQPCLGTRECMCYFSLPDTTRQPLNITKDLGIMLYDVFDITRNDPLDTRKKTYNNPTRVSFFNAKLIDGVMEIPEWSSDVLLRKESLNV